MAFAFVIYGRMEMIRIGICPYGKAQGGWVMLKDSPEISIVKLSRKYLPGRCQCPPLLLVARLVRFADDLPFLRDAEMKVGIQKITKCAAPFMP